MGKFQCTLDDKNYYNFLMFESTFHISSDAPKLKLKVFTHLNAKSEPNCAYSSDTFKAPVNNDLTLFIPITVAKNISISVYAPKFIGSDTLLAKSYPFSIAEYLKGSPVPLVPEAGAIPVTLNLTAIYKIPTTTTKPSFPHYFFYTFDPLLSPEDSVIPRFGCYNSNDRTTYSEKGDLVSSFKPSVSMPVKYVYVLNTSSKYMFPYLEVKKYTGTVNCFEFIPNQNYTKQPSLVNSMSIQVHDNGFFGFCSYYDGKNIVKCEEFTSLLNEPMKIIESQYHLVNPKLKPFKPRTVIDFNHAFSLRKLAEYIDNPNLYNVRVCLGWDTTTDLDSSIIQFDKNNNIGKIVYFGNKVEQGIKHNGDNLTGAGSGDDETIDIQLNEIPLNIDKLAITITSYGGLPLSSVKGAFLRMVDMASDQELFFLPIKTFQANTALLFAMLFRTEDGWEICPVQKFVNARVPAAAAAEFQKLLNESGLIMELKQMIENGDDVSKTTISN